MTPERAAAERLTNDDIQRLLKLCEESEVKPLFASVAFNMPLIVAALRELQAMPTHCTRWECKQANLGHGVPDDNRLQRNEKGFMVCPLCGYSYGAALPANSRPNEHRPCSPTPQGDSVMRVRLPPGVVETPAQEEIVIQGRKCEFYRSDHRKDVCWISDGNGHCLNREGKWESFEALLPCYWPTREAAIEFARSVSEGGK